MRNKEIRDLISKAGIKYWQIADEIGIADTTFTKWLRHDLSAEREQLIRKAISVVQENNSNETH